MHTGTLASSRLLRRVGAKPLEPRTHPAISRHPVPPSKRGGGAWGGGVLILNTVNYKIQFNTGNLRMNTGRITMMTSIQFEMRHKILFDVSKLVFRFVCSVDKYLT